jgi:hypothetical protein
LKNANRNLKAGSSAASQSANDEAVAINFKGHKRKLKGCLRIERMETDKADKTYPQNPLHRLNPKATFTLIYRFLIGLRAP